jgi:uncharacterized protein (DUF302 family)
MPNRRQVWNLGLVGILAGKIFDRAEEARAAEAPGLALQQSHYSTNETADRLEAEIALNGETLFARFRLGEPDPATTFGRPLQIVIFGDAKALMPVLAAAPAAALDLPIKVVIFEDEEGKVWVTYNSAAYLRERYALSDDLMSAIDRATALIDAALV